MKIGELSEFRNSVEVLTLKAKRTLREGEVKEPRERSSELMFLGKLVSGGGSWLATPWKGVKSVRSVSIRKEGCFELVEV